MLVILKNNSNFRLYGYRTVSLKKTLLVQHMVQPNENPEQHYVQYVRNKKLLNYE